MMRPYSDSILNYKREFFGMQRARDFNELKEIPEEMRERLRGVYDHVDDIDLYVGGLAETHVEGHCSTKFFEYSGIY